MSTAAPETPKVNQAVAIRLAMAMFVLVVDTSLMNVSISSVVRDLDTTVSGVQAAIALEALVSAAFILIGSKVADLIGRKRAFILGLLGYAIGALAMTLAQGLVAIIIFWAIIGGIGASLLLPSMQSLIHGNFEGAAQKKVYATVGASAAIAAAVGPLIGGFITTYLSWRVGFALEVVIIAIVLSGMGKVKDAPYTGDRRVDYFGSVLSVLGMGGLVLSILVWQEGGEAVGALLLIGMVGFVSFAYWLKRRKAEGKPALLDPGLFKSKMFRLGASGQMMQQIALGGTMIALPIYFQIVLEYDAMKAGLSLAPLSLTMFGVALLAGKRSGRRRPSQRDPFGIPPPCGRHRTSHPDRSSRRFWLGPIHPVGDRGGRVGTVGVSAEQLHLVTDLRGTDQRGGRCQFGCRIVRAVLRPCLLRSDPARRSFVHLHRHVERQHCARPRSEGAGRRCLGRRCAGRKQHPAERFACGSTGGDPRRDHPHQHRCEAARTAGGVVGTDTRRSCSDY